MNRDNATRGGFRRFARRRAPDRTSRLRRGAARLLALAVGTATVAGMLGFSPAFAATGQLYLLKATDPHGNIWLPGTTDGTTAGPVDPGTDPTSAGYGHLWTTDVPSGFCRIIPASTDPTTGAVTAASLDRNTAGGCIVAGGKPGQPALDPRRNADGTFFVYTPDWAARSNGVYRLTYDPGSQTMTKAELLAPNRFPFDNKPFDVQMGPKDGKLYVSNDKDGNIARISGVNGALSQQTVETSIAHTTDGLRSRAITFACWSALNTSRAVGAASCTPGDGTAPDLVVAQKNLITVVLNAETCQTAAGGCVTRQTPVQVLTPMGLRTDPGNPDVIYVSDSPGTTSQIIRYTISTNTQDSYANYGILDDGTSSQLAFAFSVGFGPDHAMYIGDDPTAGATAFNGRYFRIAPNAPADALGAPGKAASPPPPPAPQNGTLIASNITQPTDGVYLGGHLWIPDAVNGLCRMDPDAANAGQFVENTATCVVGANAAGMTKPEQSAFDATNNLLYVADAGSKSVGVVRFHFDPAADAGNGTLGTPEVVAAGLSGTGNGLDNQRADAVALDPTSGNLYVGFRARNLGAATQIARVNKPSAPDTTTQTVDFVAKTTRAVPVFGLGIIVNPAAGNVPSTSDLYIADNKGVDELTNVNTCQPGGCFPLLALNVRGPKGFATDGKDQLFMASPPAPGSASANTVVQRYTVSKGELFDYSAIGAKPDGTTQPYGFVFGLTLDPKTNNLYVEDDANAVAPPNGTGHVWQVAPGAGTTPAPPPNPNPTPTPPPAPAPTGTGTATAPTATLPTAVTATTTAVPVTVSWTGTGTAYELQQSTNGSAFFDAAVCTATAPCTGTSAKVSLTPSPTNKAGGTTYAFRVIAQDSTGTFGQPSAAGPTFSVPATDNTGGFSFSGAWSGVNLAGAYNGSVQESSTANATAQNANALTGTSLALVSTTGPDRGIAQLTLDGTVVGTVDLYSPTLQTGAVVWSKDGLNGVGHTLKLTVTTQKNPLSSGNKVDVDAYLALK